MRSRMKMLCAIALSLGLFQSATAQNNENVPHWILPSPLSTFQQSERDKDRAAAAMDAAKKRTPEELRRLPAVVEEIPVPAPSMFPNAVIPFSQEKRIARLIRGNEVMEISNQALRESGVFIKAINSSQKLSQTFQEFEAATLHRHQMESAMTKMRAAMPNQAALDEAVADPSSPLRQMNLVRENALDVQRQTEAAFENALWDIGLNGAKIASVSRMNEPTAQDPRDEVHMMIQAMDDAPSNNLGYTMTRVYKNGEFGMTTVPSEYLLPLPVDSNDFFFNQVTPFGTQRAPDGVMLKVTEEFMKNPIVQVLALPQFGLIYDTGFLPPGGGNFAESVSLMSRRAPLAGQSQTIQAFGNDETPVDVALNAQMMDVGGGQSLQFFAVANNDMDLNTLDVENLGVRAYNRRLGSFFEGWSVAVGTQQSVFGESAFKPAFLDSRRGTLIGTIDRKNINLPQVAVHIPLSNNWFWKIAIEDPYKDDVLFAPVPAGAGQMQLTRWPTFATNLTWSDKALNHSLHLGGVVRSFGFQEAATEREHFATGWGLSAIAKVSHNNSANFFGISGGNGVGDYIQGISNSAVATATTIRPLSGLGIFAGQQTVWRDEFQIPISEFNIAYGYSLMDTPAVTGADLNRKLHQGLLNYTRFLSDYLAVGAEYQYGYRRVRSGDVGEDHRFMLVVAVRSAAPKRSTIVENFVEARDARVELEPDDPAPGFDDDLVLPPPSDISRAAVRTLTPMGATVGSRPIEDVVNQLQLGGPAYQQGL